MVAAYRQVISRMKLGYSRFSPYLYQLLMAVFSAAAAATPLFSQLYPLGIAAAAGVSNHYALSAAVGAILGYALSREPLVALQYLIAIVGVSVLRLLFLRRNNSAFATYLLPVAAAVSILAMRILVPTAQSELFDLFGSLCEVLLLLLFAFMINIFCSEIVGLSNFSVLSSEAKASLLFVYVAAVCSIIKFTFFGLHPGVVATAIVLCIISYCYGERLSAIFAIATVAAFCITQPLLLFVSVGMAIGGLFAGLFAQGEKIGVATIFFGCSVFGVLVAPGATVATQFIIEMLIASSILIILPKSLLKVNFQYSGAVVDGRSVASYIAGRLYGFSDVLCSISQIVSEVFLKTNSVKAGDAAIDYVTENCCKNCTGSASCWTSHGEETVASMRGALGMISEKGSVGPLWLSEIFKNRCNRTAEMCSLLHKANAIEMTRRAGEAKAELMRSALSEQFSSIAAVVSKLGGEVFREEIVDKSKTAKITALFKELGLAPIEAAVLIERTGKTKICIKTSRVYLDKMQQKALTEEASYCLNKKFLPCTVRDFENITSFEFYEMARFTVEFAAMGRAAGGGEISGDILKTFCDDCGNAHAILSDGMGRGKGAAIDASVAATLTARLLQAGFAGREVAKLVNVALSLKGSDEASATLDIFSVNLYTGEGCVYKAGAAPTYLLSNGEVKKIEAATLPVGILAEVIGSEIPLSLCLFDMLVMVSDGTIGEGGEWVDKILLRSTSKTAKQIANEIIENARKHGNSQTHEDDMSVIVLKMIPAAVVHHREKTDEESLAAAV